MYEVIVAALHVCGADRVSDGPEPHRRRTHMGYQVGDKRESICVRHITDEVSAPSAAVRLWIVQDL